MTADRLRFASVSEASTGRPEILADHADNLCFGRV
jgi:hypothetical protein